MPTANGYERFWSYICPEQVNFVMRWWWWWRWYALYQANMPRVMCQSATSRKQHSRNKFVAQFVHIILIHQSVRLPLDAARFVVLRDSWRSKIYRLYSLWCDPTGYRIHDLPHTILCTCRKPLTKICPCS